ncbi:MAG: hypothetical protein ABJA98_15435 [Acidobacteriota bacterium]
MTSAAGGHSVQDAAIAAIAWGVWLLGFSTVVLRAHSGPPYPIVTERIVGAYVVAVWSDPDVTNDGSAAGQFWVVMRPNGPTTLPADTRAEVTIRPSDRVGLEQTRATGPVQGETTPQYAVLLMDHEGPFAVHVSIEGALGRADLDTNVDATYDARPAPALMMVFLAPFLLVGFLWGKLLLRRRGRTRSAT